jgi:transposase
MIGERAIATPAANLSIRFEPMRVRFRFKRRVATRYDKLAANYLAFVKLACMRLWLRIYECTA